MSGGVTAAVPAALPALTIPVLPDGRLRTNSRDGTLHWHERARLVRDAGADLRPLVLQWARDIPDLPLRGPVSIRWTLYVPAWRGDWDGWVGALKVWQDTLVQCGVLANDGPKVVREGAVRIVKADEPRTVLEITQEPAPARPGRR